MADALTLAAAEAASALFAAIHGDGDEPTVTGETLDDCQDAYDGLLVALAERQFLPCEACTAVVPAAERVRRRMNDGSVEHWCAGCVEVTALLIEAEETVRGEVSA